MSGSIHLLDLDGCLSERCYEVSASCVYILHYKNADTVHPIRAVTEHKK